MVDPGGQRLWTRAFVLLGVTELVYFSATGITIHSLPLYVTGPIGSDEAGAGMAFGAFAFTALALRPAAGRLVDRHGRRLLLLAGALLGGTGLVLLPLAQTLLVVVALRLVQGVGEAAFVVGGFAMLADLAPRERTGEALSYNSLGLYLGTALGPALGAATLAGSGFTTTWVAAAALMVLAALLVLLLPETLAAPPPADGTRSRLLHRPAVPPALGLLTATLAAGGFLAFASLHGTRIGLSQPSLALVTYGLVVVTCRLTLARVVDRFRPLPLGALSLVGIAGGLALMASWGASAGLLLGAGVLAVGIALSTPAFFTAVFASAAPHQRGAASATASAALDLGLGVGPLLLGVVARAQGVPGALAVGSVLALLGAAWVWLTALRADSPSSRIQPSG